MLTSLLDTDLYKLTMQQVVWSRFPTARAEYAFTCRSKGVDLRPYADEIREAIGALGGLRFTDDERRFLGTIRYLSSAYVEMLRGFRIDPSAVCVETDPELTIRIEGTWLGTILFEVPVLAIVNEIYFRRTQPFSTALRDEGLRRLDDKCARLRASEVPVRVMEFGTRRRYSGAWQRTVVETLAEKLGDRLLGTSNVHLAHALGLRPFGTMAHEYLQAGQAFYHVLDAQKRMFDIWAEVYRGDLGIALSDIYGTDAFLHDFDLLLAKSYDGARHDSGDPFVWGERLIAHYERLGIDPRTRTAVFSDGLDVDLAIRLAERFEGRMRTYFGMGTNLTNDLGFPALQIVLKMVRCNGRPVVKLSDTPGKVTSTDPAFLNYVRSAWGLQ